MKKIDLTQFNRSMKLEASKKEEVSKELDNRISLLRSVEKKIDDVLTVFWVAMVITVLIGFLIVVL